MQSEKDHMIHVTYKKEDKHVMPPDLPRQLWNNTKLEQARSHAEL